MARGRRPLRECLGIRLGAAVAMLVILGGCAPRPTEGDRPASVGGSLLPEDRLELPEFGMREYRGLLRELTGKVVVANIWGSWCPPCRVEAPDLAEVAGELDGDVQFVGVDILDDRGSARRFILEFDWPYPSVFD
ncbi:MAG: TlpA family protein disulfide reductase, partial [Actinomycetota bacterium]